MFKKVFEKYNIDKSKIPNPFSLDSLKTFCKNLVSMKGNPSKIALSLALGIFVGVMMPMGFQVIIVVPLALVLNLNLLIALTATLISNPLTVLPLYFIIIQVGEFLTQINISWEKIEMVIEHPGMKNFLNLGYESLIVFFSGSITLGLATSTAIYFITLKIIRNHRLKNQLECE